MLLLCDAPIEIRAAFVCAFVLIRLIAKPAYVVLNIFL